MRQAWRTFWWWFTTPTGEFLGLPEYTRERKEKR
jgi:hypothetical protein